MRASNRHGRAAYPDPVAQVQRRSEVSTRKLLVLPAIAMALGLSGPAFAGQPNASCEAAGANPPPGFSTGGFANAEANYAGSEGRPRPRTESARVGRHPGRSPTVAPAIGAGRA
jgi:hypothetical protein